MIQGVAGAIGGNSRNWRQKREVELEAREQEYLVEWAYGAVISCVLAGI